MLCVLILYISDGICRLRSIPNDRFLRKFFVTILFLLSEFLPEICNRRRNIFKYYILIWPGIWRSNKPTRYLLEYVAIMFINIKNLFAAIASSWIQKYLFHLIHKDITFQLVVWIPDNVNRIRDPLTLLRSFRYFSFQNRTKSFSYIVVNKDIQIKGPLHIHSFSSLKFSFSLFKLLYSQFHIMLNYTTTNVIGHYNLSVRIIDRVSHTTYVVCVLILYTSGGAYSLKSTLRVFARNLLRGNRRRNIFCMLFLISGSGARILALGLISQHTTY